MQRTSLQRNDTGQNLYLVGKTAGGPFFVGMASTFLPVRLIVAVVTGIASIRVRLVTLLLPYRLSAMGLSIALLLLAIPPFATVLVGFEYLVASVFEIRSSTGV